ncbi:MAG: SDR family NAD(P)-dependent oxidoreductase [Clostridia bacterium]|nr:SDR family NAD(P)-dependent oxidoreductase [Clostridia bacterium]
MSLETLAKLSNKYGSDSNFVLAGGGNTSFKDDKYLYIKGSGTTLATIKPEEFVAMDRAKLAAMWNKEYSADTNEREKEVLVDLMAAKVDPQSGRPSVETSLHDLMPFTYVVHLHPAMVNGLTCSKDADKAATELFGDSFIWIGDSEPGYVLAKKVKDASEAYKSKTGKDVQMIILKNHGIFVAANTPEEIDAIYADVMAKLSAKVEMPDFTPAEFDTDRAVALAPAIRMLSLPVVTFFCNNEAKKFIKDAKAFAPVSSAFTPDHIVYCKAEPLFVEEAADLDEQYAKLEKAINDYKAAYGYEPRVIAVQNLGIFAAGASKKAADTVVALFTDAMKIAVFAQGFGGESFMSDYLINFIKNWEVESYRASVGAGKVARVSEKIVIVTGSAQGFGQGIAEELLAEGANVVIADLNAELAEKNAAALCEKYGKGKALAVAVNVGDEASVKEMIDKTVLAYGGLDALVSNAGIVRAGSLEEMTVNNFNLVTNVNYLAYFLCAKYSAAVMKIQNKFNPDYYMDIIQINSKSGLSGSNKNFAYAGSKFGGIGLTHSFALELCPFNIKVNSVCPGNFLDGPLWCDPEKGLFKQYLEAGKVPGAKTVADVKKFYEAKVPMNRGCRTADVMKAIFYCMEQQYETGQAIPVTGGQNMLK